MRALVEGLTRRWGRPGASLVLGGWLVAACSGAHEPTQRGPEATRPLADIKPTTNVPALLGQSIEGLRRRLGPVQVLPDFAGDSLLYANLAPRATDSLATFHTGGLLLLVSYDIRTRHVNDLLLLGHHEDSLMHRAALRANAPDYLLLPTFQSLRPGVLLGLRVVPANRD